MNHLKLLGAAPHDLDLTPRIEFRALDLTPIVSSVAQSPRSTQSQRDFEIYISREDDQLISEGTIKLFFHSKDLPKRTRRQWELSLGKLLGRPVAIEPHVPGRAVIRVYPSPQ